MGTEKERNQERPASVVEGAALWHGRFRAPAGSEMRALADSIEFDAELWPHDLDGTAAHVEMLGATGLLSPDDLLQIRGALAQVRAEMTEGRFDFGAGDEDIHSAIERRVTEIAGSAGAKIHTGRSRNDQVATALRLWTRDQCTAVADACLDLVDELCRAADSLDALDPPAIVAGYTHLQRAQVVLASHHLRAHCWALLRDVERVRQVRASASVSPLGAGALGGSSLPLDPHHTARLLGMESVFANSMDAVADRDFVADLLHACTMIGLHLSRLGEEWVLWSSAEFGFVVLDDRYSTGSSMLPQKRNPDIAELARGKAGRLIGNLTGFLATLKGLPLAYNRDLQEDKEPLFDSVRQIRTTLAAVTAMVAHARFDTARMRTSASSPELAAIDLAEHLVTRGMPFREAHATVGALVARAEDEARPLADIAAASGLFGDDLGVLLDPDASVARRVTPGGGGPRSAASQRTALRAAVDRARANGSR